MDQIVKDILGFWQFLLTLGFVGVFVIPAVIGIVSILSFCSIIKAMFRHPKGVVDLSFGCFTLFCIPIGAAVGALIGAPAMGVGALPGAVIGAVGLPLVVLIIFSAYKNAQKGGSPAEIVIQEAKKVSKAVDSNRNLAAKKRRSRTDSKRLG